MWNVQPVPSEIIWNRYEVAQVRAGVGVRVQMWCGGAGCCWQTGLVIAGYAVPCNSVMY